MKKSLLFLVLMSVFCGFSQVQFDSASDVDASFPGGATEMRKFIQAEILYPQIALQNWDQGRLYVAFIVEKDGSLTNIQILGQGLTPELDREAMRLVSIMPRWIPGTMNGEIVRAQCRLPITFTLGGKPPRKIRKRQKRNR